MAPDTIAAAESVDEELIPATVRVVRLAELDREPDVLDNYTPVLVPVGDGVPPLLGWVCRRPHRDSPTPSVLVLANPAPGGGITQAGTTLGEMAEQLAEHEEEHDPGAMTDVAPSKSYL